MSGPLVTVLLAAYKGNAYAGEQIESILAQTYRNFRLVLSDDGEETAGLLQSYADRYPDRVVHHRSGRRFGSAQKHFLYLTEQFADAGYLMFSDQDDRWHPDKIEKTLALMRKTEAEAGEGKPVLVHTDLAVVDGSLKPLDPSFCHYSRLDGSRLELNQILVQNVVTGCTVMINRTLAGLALRGKDRPEMRMHDWWMALCAAAFGKAAFLPEVTIDYRQHGGNVVGAKDPRSLAYIWKKIRGSEVREALTDTAAQAGAFLEVYRELLTPEQRTLLQAYAAVPEKNKIARLSVYRRYGLWKQDPRRRAGQILWW